MTGIITRPRDVDRMAPPHTTEAERPGFDLQDLLHRTKGDFDPTTEQARAARMAANVPQPARG